MNKQELIEMAVVDLSGDFDNTVVPLRYFMMANNETAKRESVGFAFTDAIATREEFNAAADRMRGKPDWKDAPVWAQWLAQDSYGDWYWYPRQENAPTQSIVGFVNKSAHRLKNACGGKVIGDWRNTLEKRPELKVETDITENVQLGCGVSSVSLISSGESGRIMGFKFEPAPVSPWFVAGELPKAGECCEYKFQNPDVSWQLVQVNYISAKHAILTILEDGNECHADGFKVADFRPVRTDKEKVIEFALSKIHNGMNRHAAPYIIEQIYDAGLLRLPDSKKPD